MSEIVQSGSQQRVVRPTGCDMVECQGEEEEQCLNHCPGSGMICTLPHGHDGDHIACGTPPRHNLRRWPNE